jgi:hypothetical protein
MIQMDHKDSVFGTPARAEQRWSFIASLFRVSAPGHFVSVKGNTMKIDQKTEPLLELDLGTLSQVTGGAGKNAIFNIFSNQKQYSGATPGHFKMKRR